MKKFNLIKIVFLFSLLIVKGSIQAQNSLSLEDVLAISIKENIDIKIKTNELNQVKNYEKVGVLGTIPKIKVFGISFSTVVKRFGCGQVVFEYQKHVNFSF